MEDRGSLGAFPRVMPALVAVALIRVFIDPGHGAAGNEGALTARCEREQEVTLELARDLGERLRATGKFEVLLARTSTAGPSYPARIEAAERFRARAIVSLHLDARGDYREVGGCPRNDGDEGFAVLFSDQGAKKLVEKRRLLSRALAASLAEHGFGAYDGWDYAGLYDVDEREGVFIDRRGLMMLRRPAIPSVIIETQQGFSLAENVKWDREETRARFAEAVGAALQAFVRPR